MISKLTVHVDSKKKIPQNIRKFHKNRIPAFVRQKQGSVISATATESQPKSQNQLKKKKKSVV